MTVNTTNITSGPYAGNGVTSQFSYTFRVETKDQLIVYETDSNSNQTTLTVDIDYTVSGVGNEGGVITRTAGALPTGYSWYIRSNYQNTQLTDFDSQAGFFPDVHERSFDKLTFLIQQINDRFARSVKINDGDENGAIASLPSAEARAVLRWKNDLSGFENYQLESGGTVADASAVNYDGVSVGQYLDDKEVTDYVSLRATPSSSAIDGHTFQVEYREFSEDGGGGTFVFLDSNLSVEVARDTQSGLYVAPDFDATGASGAFVRRFSGIMSAAWFGFYRTNTGPENSAAIQGGFAATGNVYATLTIDDAYTYTIGDGGTLIDNDPEYDSPKSTTYGIMFTGGKSLICTSNCVLVYSGSGNAIYFRNSANHLSGCTLLVADSSESAIKVQGSLNEANNIVITKQAGGTTGPGKGVWLYSDRTTLQSDWNRIRDVTINPAVVPVTLEAVRAAAASGSIGAVNANAFKGEVNWRTSTLTNGVVVYLNGGTAASADVVGNTFEGMDVTNYGGAGSRSVVLDGPNSKLSSFTNVVIDTSMDNIGYTIGAGTSGTKIIGGTNDAALTQYEQNNIDGVNNVYDFIAANNYVYIPRIHGEGWSSPTFLNSWVNFGGSEATAQYWKDSTETVHIKGLISSGTTTAGTQIFVLPVGYRPTENLTKTVVCGAAGARVIAAITINVNGAVSVDTCSSNTALSLECSFRVF